MSKMKKIIGLMLVFAMVIGFESTVVHASEVALCYVNSSNCTVTLKFSSNTANCSLYVKGKSGTSSISGTLKLYDVTASKTVKTWTISKTGSLYTGSKSKAVTAGHKYRLSFSGKVYDKYNVAESVSAKVTKKN